MLFLYLAGAIEESSMQSNSGAIGSLAVINSLDCNGLPELKYACINSSSVTPLRLSLNLSLMY